MSEVEPEPLTLGASPPEVDVPAEGSPVAASGESPREHRIPLTLEYPKPNKESLESIREADEIARNGGPTYASAKEMFGAMGV